MTTAASPYIEAWYIDPRAEDAMAEGHGPIWRRLIDLLPEKHLAARSVLDFGCSAVASAALTSPAE